MRRKESTPTLERFDTEQQNRFYLNYLRPVILQEPPVEARHTEITDEEFMRLMHPDLFTDVPKTVGALALKEEV